MAPADCAILLIEDDPAILRLAVLSLEAGGFQKISTHTCIATAREAWQAHPGKFDLLLTDFSLPDESAEEFIDELLQAKPELAVLIMTGFSRDVLPLHGNTSVIEKPFRPSELRAAVLDRLPRLSPV